MTWDILFFACAGFLAQLVDGALGMAYGVTCNSLLLAFGYTPAVASASVHLAEIATSGVSGHFHWKLGNVDLTLFKRLVWPGMVGGAIGAYALSNLPADQLRPWIALYLALMGCRILLRARRPSQIRRSPPQRTEFLGFVGGLFDAIGGGGWGPIVTTTLVGGGLEPRTAIGSANRAEFFVTVVQSFTFALFVGLGHWPVILGLCIGGVAAAPLAAHVVRSLAAETLMTIVGILIILLSLRTIVFSIAGI